MFKSLCVITIVGIVLTETALAGGPCCCSSGDGAAPQAAAQSPAAAPALQAQRPQSTRSFSYQPSVNNNYSNYPARRNRIDFSYGERAAGSKLLGNY